MTKEENYKVNCIEYSMDIRKINVKTFKMHAWKQMVNTTRKPCYSRETARCRYKLLSIYTKCAWQAVICFV